MTTQEYFEIGSVVKYLRHDGELKVYDEVGIVRAIFVDPDNRLMAQVKNGDNAFNAHYSTLIDVYGVWPTDFVKAYKDLLQDIRSTSNEGDKLVEETVERYNAVVQTLTSDLLGDPLVLAALPEDEPTLAEVAGNA